MLIDIIVSVILVVLVGAAITYIVRSKKRGETCVGCPYAKECAMRKKNGGCSGGNHAAPPADASQGRSDQSE
ncbi:MAG: hypothetical protein IJX47_08430 [Clostridia bacterium]|nr:hypothetical protein [Clostridia bacterium]